jgi:Tol biopolymer transport system component
MTLSSGTTLGPYQIVGSLGAGGMGEVYRAHDPRLGRDVAMKVLSPWLAATPEARARFEREARTISQLNHPHICTLFDVGREGDTDFLVMELLEGETLAHRLEKGPLPVAELLSLGAQIADALDRAHRAGVVHRDLKPANVMLTKGGAKLMDFGLARAAPAPDGRGLTVVPGDLSESPTVSRPLTREGTLVGTFQYMAPEQLEGKEADARSDIWALGCVLYEMATGKLAFEGTSQASLVAAIMEHEPPAITVLKPLTPPTLEHLVNRCLAKAPADRWQSTRDVMLELRWIAGQVSQGDSRAGALAPAAMRGRRRERLAWTILAAALAVALVGVSALHWARHLHAPELVRLTVTAPAGQTIRADNPSAAISPDGRTLVFGVFDAAGTRRLWIRRLDTSSAQPLAVTENADFPFWSPDGRFIAFFAGNKLRKVPAAGGPPETICEAPDARGGSWSTGGNIVFAPLATGPLARVSSDGGEVVTIVRPDSTRGETGLRWPCILPDGRHFLYVSIPEKQGQFDVYLGDLRTGKTQRVMTAASAPVYAEPGYLFFERDRRLVAQRFDLSRMRPTGRVIALDDAPPFATNTGAPILFPPSTDALVLIGAKTPDSQLTWLDRTGRRTGTVPLPPGHYEFPRLSPDDHWATVLKLYSAERGDLWIVDLQRAVATPATFDSSAISEGRWAPGGSCVAYCCKRSGRQDIYQMHANGKAPPELLVRASVMFASPMTWSPDGKYFLYGQLGRTTLWDLWLLPLNGERKPVPYLCTPYNEYGADISPDGHWLAYASEETGRSEVYVASFPEPGEKYRISTSGGTGAQWSGDGKELLIWAGGDQSGPVVSLFSVDVQTTPTFKCGTPRLLFTQFPDVLPFTAATRDLQRFLAAVPVEGTTPPSITVLLNWQVALKEDRP